MFSTSLLKPTLTLLRPLTVTLTHAPSHRLAHTVSVILTADSPTAKGYTGDVVDVKAGYMRNFLYPNKKAVYATKENLEAFEGTIIKAKEISEKASSEKEKVESEGSLFSDKQRREIDMVALYMKSRVIKIKREIDKKTNKILSGVASISDAIVLQKLQKQHGLTLEEGDSLVMEDRFRDVLGEGEFVGKILLKNGGEVKVNVEVMRR